MSLDLYENKRLLEHDIYYMCATNDIEELDFWYKWAKVRLDLLFECRLNVISKGEHYEKNED